MPGVRRAAIFAIFLSGCCLVIALSTVSTSARQAAPPPAPAQANSPATVAPRGVLDKYCISCHNQKTRTAGLALDTVDAANPIANAELWEKVIARLQQGSMPPPGRPRPDVATYHAVASALENDIDRAWAANPNPGRIGAVHRLNRAEYNNAIRDLFALDIDVKPLLPGDETADGSFDNFADSLSISTAHLERYLSVARQVTRLATGLPPAVPKLETFEIPLHVTQDDRQGEDTPFGSRGGIAVRYNFPVDGEYTIKVRLQRQYQDYLKGMGWPQQLDIRVDGKLLKRFGVGGGGKGRPAATSYAGDGEPGFAGDPEWEEYMQVTGDKGLDVRVPVSAGPHTVAATFVREMFEAEGLPQPVQRARVIADDNVPMEFANVNWLQIGGPYKNEGPAKDTPSRRVVFVCQPKTAADESACATRILSRMARLAYRRPVTSADTQTLMKFFEDGRRDGKNFESVIQFALERMLVDPDFLVRVHRDPQARSLAARSSAPAPGGAYRLSDIELASRLSFFLWSSIPDDRLLSLAERGQLANPAVLEKETRRMLADPRAVDSLVNNFAAQWLNLRRVDEVVVDPTKYPNYDLSLMQGFQKETELFVGSNIKEDRPVSELLDANYTFLNEKLARHYDVPGVYGSRFRRVTLPSLDQRGGLLAHGALMATTSYPDRTSPVLRGKWLLNNIFGLPIPAPPPGVDTNLDNKPGGANLPIRERLAQHRVNPSCSSCHGVIDPLGFALENFDVIGGWRTKDEKGNPVDASGTTVSGARIEGLAGLRTLLLAQPDQFPRTVTEKLMTYGLGRMLQYYDRPAVRRIVRDAAASNYRWSSLIVGIAKSPAFLMRTAPSSTN
jgi:mono/diheme cytochrome c family protein